MGNSGENKNGKSKSDYRLLFSKRYLKLTILMTSVFFMYYFATFGLNISIPIILKNIQDKNNLISKHHPKKHYDPINNLILFTFLNIPLLPAILAENKTLGKKYSQIIFIIVSLIFSSTAIIFPKYFYVLIFSSSAFIHYGF